jgi:uncharacterized protein YqjF (DUF2071 family)
VFFFSLDATNPIAVHAARLMFRLPYHTASMTVERSAAGVHYRSERRGQSSRRAEFAATYRPVGPVFNATPGSLEYFLTERYCFYARNHRNKPYRLEIQHVPWPLQLAEAEIERNSMAAASAIVLPGTAPLLHFAKRQDIVAWAPTRATKR